MNDAPGGIIQKMQHFGPEDLCFRIVNHIFNLLYLFLRLWVSTVSRPAWRRFKRRFCNPDVLSYKRPPRSAALPPVMTFPERIAKKEFSQSFVRQFNIVPDFLSPSAISLRTSIHNSHRCRQRQNRIPLPGIDSPTRNRPRICRPVYYDHYRPFSHDLLRF